MFFNVQPKGSILPSITEGSVSDRLKSPAAASLASLVTVKELATILHMGEGSVRAAVAKGQIPHLRLGARIRFDLEQVRAAFRPSATPNTSGAA
ncbi:MAG TPA: helix-turn-helix domain-containing protein [Polyangia bacterium]